MSTCNNQISNPQELNGLKYQLCTLINSINDEQKKDIIENLKTLGEAFDDTQCEKRFKVWSLIDKLNKKHTPPVLTGLDFEKDDESSFYIPAMYIYNDSNIKLNGKNPFKILTIRESPNLSSYFSMLLEVSLTTMVNSQEHSFTAELLCDICLASNEFTIGLPSELTNQDTLRSHTVGLMYILNRPHYSFHEPIDKSFNNAINNIAQDLRMYDGKTEFLVNQAY